MEATLPLAEGQHEYRYLVRPVADDPNCRTNSQRVRWGKLRRYCYVILRRSLPGERLPPSSRRREQVGATRRFVFLGFVTSAPR